VKATDATWLARPNLSEEAYQIEGDETVKRLAVRVTGTPTIAARRVTAAVGALNIGNRGRERIAVEDAQGLHEEQHVSEDKSPPQLTAREGHPAKIEWGRAALQKLVIDFQRTEQLVSGAAAGRRL
ncbi:unnamed protein product, partial [Prorocentrum cordatum]